jgi:hypothetical protein
VQYTYVHLGRETLFTIANHSVRCKSNHRRRGDTVLTLPFSNFGRSFKTALGHVSVTMSATHSSTYHDRHLYVHEYAIEAFLLNVLDGLETVVCYSDSVVVLLQDSDS